jgi:anti-sigma factor RsiW
MSDFPTPESRDLPDLPCNVFVELVTDYLEDALEPHQRAWVDAHLASCGGCETVLAQWRETIALTGRLREAEVDRVDPETRHVLLETFRQVRH